MKASTDHCILDMLDLDEDSWGLDEECPIHIDDFLLSLGTGDLENPLMMGSPGLLAQDESPDEIIKGATSYDNYDLDLDEFTPSIFANTSLDMDTGEEEDDKTDIKTEPRTPRSALPLSPSPSHSESSGSDWQQDSYNTGSLGLKFSLDTPPISPPETVSPPISPQPEAKSQQLQQIKLITVNSRDQTAAQLALAKSKATKRVCKIDTNNSGEQPRKMIVLSAQDFAALTKKVKQNSNSQPLKIQALPKKRQVELQNNLNLQSQEPAKLKNTIQISQPNRVKIINSLPTFKFKNVETKPVIAETINETVKTSSSPPRIPMIIKKESTNYPPIVIKNEVPEMVNLAVRQDCEIKAIKRQQRMIKNRESACLSRKKKKEYVTSLEKQISDLQEENRQLKCENAALKKRLSATEEMTGASKKFGNLNLGINKKNTAVFLAMVLMVSLNVTSLGSVFSPDRRQLETLSSNIPSAPLPNIRHGRTLLWTPPEDDDIKIENKTVPVHHPMCPMYINQTESIRLDYELRRWIGDDFDHKNWTRLAAPIPKIKSLGEWLLPKPSSLQPKFTEKLKVLPTTKDESVPRRVTNSIQSMNSHAVEVFSPKLREHASLFDALRRRDDTFYVVWFSGEHLLLPASRQNNTARPRMSLVFPAVPVNESFSAPPDHVTMMQIDCEVTNTQLLHLQESVIPKHLRGNRKASSAPSRKNDVNEATVNLRTANATQKYKPYFVKLNETDALPNKNFNSSTYSINDKDSYTVEDDPYILKDKFVPEFLDTEKYSTYAEKNNLKIVDSRRGKKFRRRGVPGNQ